MTRVLRVFRLLAIILVATLLPVGAADVGLTFGHVGLFDSYYRNGLHVHLGLTAGVTGRVEVNLFTQSEITPRPFGDVQLGFDVAYSLLGKRWDTEGYAGSGVNMLVSAGMLAGTHNDSGLFQPDSLFVKLTPVTVGTSHVGKRDRFLMVGLDWNLHNNRLSFVWNFMLTDIYLAGTWRDALR